MEYKFRYNDEAVAPKLDELMMVEGVGRHIINGEACKEVARILSLDTYTDAEELRGVRNSVVKLIREKMRVIEEEMEKLEGSKAKDAIIHKVLFEADMRYHTYISAITSVIDRYMLKIDPSSV